MMWPGWPPFGGKGGCMMPMGKGGLMMGKGGCMMKGKGGGKGPPGTPVTPATPATPGVVAGQPPSGNGDALEAAFNAARKSFNDAVRNLQLSPADIRKEFEVLMKARLELHAVKPGAVIAPQPYMAPAPPMMQMGMGMGVPMGMPGAGGDEEQVNWKGLLNQHAGKLLKKVLQAGDFEYVTESADPADPTKGGFVCTLLCHCMEQQSFQGSNRPSKKLAEQDAAKCAVEALFPDSVPAVMGGMWGAPGGKQPPAKKRKLNPADPDGDAKMALNRGMQALVDRPLAKGDVTYTTEGPDESQMYVCTLTLAGYDNGTYIGERAKSKKEAETSAAEIAYKAMESVIVPKLQERQQLKSAKNAEKLALLKEQQKAKKEAGQTAADPAAAATG